MPALIIQNNVANRNIDKVIFKGVTVLPLLSNLTGDDLRRVTIHNRPLLKPIKKVV